MSRIHEALQKARLLQNTGAHDLPDTDEIIVAGTSWTAPEPAAAIEAEPLDILSQSDQNSHNLLANCAKMNWLTSTQKLVFLGEDSRGSGQEQFRTLRSRLYQLRGNNTLSVLVVSSAIPDEGKSFVSCNLAHAFALQSGRRVLVIDADLRRADGSTALLGANETPGLTDYLQGDLPLSSVLQSGPIENLYLIPCGRRVSNAGELISDPKFEAMLNEVRPLFDWIIIDTPPVVPISDARVLADLSDGVLLVVNAQSTHAHLAKRAVREFHPESLLGIVLNKTTDVAAHYYSEYGYEHDTAAG